MNKKTQQKLLNIVKQNYEDIADDFSNTRNYIWPKLRNVIASPLAGEAGEAKQSRDNYSVLDLGCGNGRLFELFKNTNAEYTGIDQSHNLIKLAKQKYPNAKFIQGNILNLQKITLKKFNLILLIAVLPHIPSHEMRLQFLKQVKNYLKTDSTFIITCWDLRASSKHKFIILKNNLLKIFGLNKMDFNDILFPGFNKKTPRYYHAFTKKSLENLLKQAGFNIEKIYSDTRFDKSKTRRGKNIYAICKS